MVYNITAIDAANTTSAVIIAADDLTGGWWGRLFLIGMWLVIAVPVWMSTGETLKGMISASFVVTILSALMYGADMVGYKEPLFSVVLLAALVTTLLLGGFRR